MSLFNAMLTESDESTKPLEIESQVGSTSPAEETKKTEPKWWWDDKTPGTGDRPDWLPEKYKRVSDVANAYTELEKKWHSEAVESYDLSSSEAWLDTEYEPIKEMVEFAKSKRVPQEVVDKMLGAVGQYLDEFNIDYEEERKQLGDNAKERLHLLDNWVRANFSQDAYQSLTNNLRTADSVKALEEIRSKMINNSTTIPGSNDASESTFETYDDIQDEMTNNMKKYKEDSKYRKEIMRRFEIISERSK